MGVLRGVGRRTSLALFLLAAAPGAPAWGAPPVNDGGSARAEAARRFKAGEAAFKKHDYEGAAAAFEQAYAIAPHPAALANAIESREKAGQLARAANLCARLVADPRAGEAERDQAARTLAALSPRLGKLDVSARGAERFTIDGAPAEPGAPYVEPGDHLIAATIDGKPVERRVAVAAGSSERVLLVAAAPPPGPVTQAEPSGKPLSPVWFFAGAGGTLVLGGVLVWSGLDTTAARRAFNANPTQAGLDAGKAKQTRTNALIGATAGLGALSAAVGLFAVDWRRGDRGPQAPSATAGIVIGPASAAGSVTGRF